jgi:hypothetical protein
MPLGGGWGGGGGGEVLCLDNAGEVRVEQLYAVFGANISFYFINSISLINAFYVGM